MSHTTVNGTTTASAVAQSDAAASFVSEKQDRLLRTAERMVKSLAPPPPLVPPATEDAAYKTAAGDTEIQVFDFLAITGENALSSEALSGVDSSSYRSYREAVKPIVADSMAAYYVGDVVEPTGDNGIARIGRLRL